MVVDECVIWRMIMMIYFAKAPGLSGTGRGWSLAESLHKEELGMLSHVAWF